MIVTLTKEAKRLLNTYGSAPRVEHWIYLSVGDNSRSVRIPTDAREKIHEYWNKTSGIPEKHIRFIIEMDQDSATLVGMEFLGWVDRPFEQGQNDQSK